MVFKDVGGPDLITDKFIDHLEITKTFVLALKRTNRQAIGFTIVVCFLSAVDTPTELAALDVEFVNLIDWIKFKGLDLLWFWIGDDGVVVDLVFGLDRGLNGDLVEKHFAVVMADRLDRNVVFVSDQLVV
jgi:hypothetical protein